MRTLTFEILGQRAYQMADPRTVIRWTPGMETRPPQFTEWPDATAAWIKIVQQAAEKAMRYEHELFSGPLRIDMVLHWQRPQKHYHADGRIKQEFIDDLPTQKPLAIETARGIAWALERILFYNRDQLVDPHIVKIWAQPHQGYKLVITVTQITAREVDPWAAAQPKPPTQQELGL